MVDLNALTEFVETTLDYSELYEDEAGTFDFQDVRVYWERKRRHFNLHVGAVIHQLPR
jgi:hypothetical protein